MKTPSSHCKTHWGQPQQAAHFLAENSFSLWHQTLTLQKRASSQRGSGWLLRDAARIGCHFNGPKGSAIESEWLLEKCLLFLSPVEVALGKTMWEAGSPSLLKATESSALAIKTCWQREMEKKTCVEQLLGRELYLFSFNFYASLERSSFYSPEKGHKYPTAPHFLLMMVTAAIIWQSWVFLPKSVPFATPVSSVKAKAGQLPSNMLKEIVTSAFELRFQFSNRHRTKSEEPRNFWSELSHCQTVQQRELYQTFTSIPCLLSSRTSCDLIERPLCTGWGCVYSEVCSAAQKRMTLGWTPQPQGHHLPQPPDSCK